MSLNRRIVGLSLAMSVAFVVISRVCLAVDFRGRSVSVCHDDAGRCTSYLSDVTITIGIDESLCEHVIR